MTKQFTKLEKLVLEFDFTDIGEEGVDAISNSLSQITKILPISRRKLWNEKAKAENGQLVAYSTQTLNGAISKQNKT